MWWTGFGCKSATRESGCCFSNRWWRSRATSKTRNKTKPRLDGGGGAFRVGRGNQGRKGACIIAVAESSSAVRVHMIILYDRIKLKARHTCATINNTYNNRKRVRRRGFYFVLFSFIEFRFYCCGVSSHHRPADRQVNGLLNIEILDVDTRRNTKYQEKRVDTSKKMN